MKILFVASANNQFGPAPFVVSQFESLKSRAIDVSWFLIKGKGLAGYLKAIFYLRRYLRDNHADLIHAHYGLSGLAARLAKPKRIPLVVSLMGSDLTGCISRPKWSFEYWLSRMNSLLGGMDRVIVKSQNLQNLIPERFRHKTEIVPNGVNFKEFYPIEQKEAREKLGLPAIGEIVLFLGNPRDSNKNFDLLKEALLVLPENKLKLIAPYPVDHQMVLFYLNAADLLVLPSLLEGSPNVIKEAMACNCPIVATDVGDVKWVMGDTNGCFLASFSPDDVAAKIKMALDYKKRAKGRERLIELSLDSESIARRIVEIYESVVKKVVNQKGK